MHWVLRQSPCTTLAEDSACRGYGVNLSAYIVSAADGTLVIGVKELPDLLARATHYEGIALAVQEAAALLTGRPPTNFTVDISL